MTISFSIAVPVGAWHRFLPANLASLANQKADVRVSLLDASGDPRVAALSDERAQIIRYRRRGPDAGQSDAIIEGWDNTPGDILGWLNADDILMPGALERVRDRFAAEPALDMIYGHSAILDAQGRMVGYHWAVEPPGPRIFEAAVISQPSCFFRRSAFVKAGGLDKDLHYTMDWDLWIRLYKSGANVAFLDEPLSMVMWGEETKTASFNAGRRAELRRIIQTYAPPALRKKIYRAFAINALIGKVRPSRLQNFIGRYLHRNAKAYFGLRGDGLVQSEATLHLAHYGDEPKRRVQLAFDHPPRGERLDADHPIARVEETGRGLIATFEKPVEPGRTLVVKLSAPRGGRTYFRHCAWL